MPAPADDLEIDPTRAPLGPEWAGVPPAALARALRAAGLPAALAAAGAIGDDHRARIEAGIDRALGADGRLGSTVEAPAVPFDLAGEATVLWRQGGPTTAPGPDEPTPDHLAHLPTRDASDLGTPPPGGPRRAEGDGASRRFTVLKPYKSGGLGLVSIARDEELHREVAYKEIREVYVHLADKRARFVAEAEITGNLEHPGIVPVYALGHDARGRPFYAMKFIRGETLRDAVVEIRARGGSPRERRLALREVLNRLIDVCDAVQYAHSRGVLHRDIKPANILLGKYGETLVVDWGLAKVVARRGRPRPDAGPAPASATGETPSSDELPFELHTESAEGETPPGSAVGTPGFMSPEQAKGPPEDSAEERAIGPRSDVYSLGATLYYILTGRVTIETADRVDYLRRLAEGDIRRPRQLDPAVPRALDAICMKALATDPDGRYDSPHDLADDLNHWLADEPTVAYRDPIAGRAFRWVRRHKPVVAGAAMFLVATVAVLAANLGVILQEKRRSDALLDRLAGDAMTTLDAVRYRDTGAAELPSMPRITLANQAADVCEELLRQRPEDPTTLERAAASQRDAGNMNRVAGQYDRAGPQLDRAIGHYEALLAASPDAPRLRTLYAQALFERALLDELTERWADAERDMRAILGLDEDGSTYSYPKIRAALELASILADDGRLDQATELAGPLVDRLRGLVGSFRPSASLRHRLVLALGLLATIERERGHPEAALPLLDEALAAIPLPASSPLDQPDAVFLRAETLRSMGDPWTAAPGRLPEADARLGESARLLGDLAAKYPEIWIYQIQRMQAHNARARLRLRAGEPPDRIGPDLDAVDAMARRIEASEPKGFSLVQSRAEAALHAILSGLLTARIDPGRAPEARASIERGRQVLAGIRRSYPRHPRFRRYDDLGREALDGLAAPKP